MSSRSFILLILLAWAIPAVAFADAAPDFAKGGLPYVQKYCINCHSGDRPKAELSLVPFTDAASIVKQRKTWDNALRMIRLGEMPPKNPKPTLPETEAFEAHIKAIFDHHDRNAKPDPGRVTMRRLNRVEYRNTIRDLIGVDFDPTEDFPSDDIGHGFDNIGDVLSISPVLMERYLGAAENIMNRAITPEPPAVIRRHLSTLYSEPASGDVAKKVIVNGYRRVSSDGKEAIEVGPVHTPYKWEDDGEYDFRTKVYAHAAVPPEPGAKPPIIRVAILVTGQDLPGPTGEDELKQLVGNVPKGAKILEIVEVKAAERGKAQTIQVRVPRLTGRERMMVALVKPAQDQPAVQLFIEYLALDGPLDPRPATQRRLLDVAGGGAKDQPHAQQSRVVMARFLRRAFRRPITEDELDRSLKLIERTMAAGEKWESAVQLAMQAALCSPKFLFRVELDDRPQAPEARALDEFQLASRLSYFIWSTMPDDELLDLAEKKQLTANLEPQVRRMLADPKSSALVSNFAMQWLQIQRINTISPDGALFASFDDRLRQAMLTETQMFFESIIREDRSILTLIDADYTFLNESLARHYGIADTHGNLIGQKPGKPAGERFRGREFKRVTLQDRNRGGLLTQGSVLTVTSNPTRTSPVKRGKWVLEQILGAPPPPPPPDVPELEEEGKAITAGTLRQRLEEHRKNPACANCHAKMDPIGFALENFNAVGAFRTKDGELPIDSTGEFSDGQRFTGPADLKSIIMSRKDDFARCLTEKMLTYALGRGVEYYDLRTVDTIVKTLAEKDFKFSILVTGIVQSDAFRMRRGSDEKKDE